MKWQTLNSKTVYKNPWIRVREDKIINPSGENGIYGVVEIPDGVFVLALNTKNDILLVKQQRYCTNMTSWELPGGGLKKKNTIQLQAKEELGEEAGTRVRSLELLGETQTQPGVTTQIDHFFLARGARFTKTSSKSTQQDEGISQVAFFPIKKVLSMIEKKDITHGQTITALMLYFLKKNLINEKGSLELK